MREELRPVHARDAGMFRLILVWIALTSVYPFMFFPFSWHPYKLALATAIGLMLVLPDRRAAMVIRSDAVAASLFVQGFGVVLMGLIHGETVGVTLLLQVASTALLFMYIQGRCAMAGFARSYIWFMILMGAAGWIVFLGAIAGVINPIGAFERPGKSAQLIQNFGLSFSNAVYPVGNGLIVRVAGFFDEPGNFAFHITLALLVNRVIFANKRLEWLLILAGIPTLSYAHAITVVAILSLSFVLGVGPRPRRHWLRVLVLIVAAVAIGGSGSIRNSNLFDRLVEVTVERWSGGGSLLTGHGRYAPFVDALSILRNRPLLGYGHTAADSFGSILEGASFAGLLVKNGIVGASLLLSPLWIWLAATAMGGTHLSVRRRNHVVCVITYALNLLQRPQVLTPMSALPILLIIDNLTQTRGESRPTSRGEDSLNRD